MKIRDETFKDHIAEAIAEAHDLPSSVGAVMRVIEAREAAELARIGEVLRRVVLDYGGANCDDLHHCDCSMAAAYRVALTVFEGGDVLA